VFGDARMSLVAPMLPAANRNNLTTCPASQNGRLRARRWRPTTKLGSRRLSCTYPKRSIAFVAASWAFEVDQVFFQYSRAAKELWKFCSTADPETTARLARA
jgi:hypothetical protein